MTPELLDVAPDLKLIVHAAGSIKPIVTDSVYERGITVTSGAGAIAIGVAETTLGLIITSMKNVFALSTAIREGGWRARGRGPQKRQGDDRHYDRYRGSGSCRTTGDKASPSFLRSASFCMIPR